MRSTLAALALQVGTVLGAPATLLARDDSYIYGPYEGEDTKIAYGDSNFNFGDRVPSSFLDAIAEGCSSLGCDPGQTFDISVLQITGASVGSDVTIKMTVDGEFNGVGSGEQDPGSKAHLLALAKLAFQEVYNSGVATVETGVPYRKNPCPPSQVHGCAGQSGGTADQWTSTNSLHVRVNARDNNGQLTHALAGSLKVKFSSSEDDSSNGVCAALSAIGAGAGLANQYVGFGVGLASIVCGELMD